MNANSGQATAEFIIVSLVALIAFGAISFNAKQICSISGVENWHDCDSIVTLFRTVLADSLVKITSIINMPW